VPNKRKESLGLIDPASKYVTDSQILSPAEAKKARKKYRKDNPNTITDPPLRSSPISIDRRGDRGMTLNTVDNIKVK
tara:strand:+ start:63 stop:293 length:231 start_codon:yes stop_codon:yes gene_type:complete